MASPFKSLKVQDVRELQELVAESVSAVEPGMRLLDTRVLLGGATIDLLALDAEDRLTLIALGLGADDEMLLRAIEAYSWCQEYPDALHRLYSTVHDIEGRPPRVIFVAERVPDAFLRKVKHLRLDRAECLEFHFGLQFTPVEELRGTDEPPPRRQAASERHAPPAPERHASPAPERQVAAGGERHAPAPAERHTPSPAASERQAVTPVARVVAPARPAPRATQRQDSEGRSPVVPLRSSRPEPVAPPRREAETGRPAPTAAEATRAESRRDAPADPAEVQEQVLEQLRSTTTTVGEWSGATDKASAEVDDEKVRAVREYMQREFPTLVIYDFYAHDRGVQMFHLQDSHGALVHSAAVGEDLLDGSSDAELDTFLDKHKLARVLRQAGSAGVSVTKSGLKIERR